MIKIGDKVRFLSSVGGGIVKKIQDKQMVLVEDENGFDYPVPVRECVVVVEAAPLQKSAKIVVAEPAKDPEPTVAPVAKETAEGERLNVFLAYLPIDPLAITEGGFEAYFINESNYYLYFSYMNRSNNSWIGRCQGLVEPNTKIFMEDFRKEDINGLERVCVQLIAFKKDKPFGLKNAVSVELRLETVKFFKAHCFMDNDFFDEGALIVPVVRADVPEKLMLVSAVELQTAMMRQKQDDLRPSTAERLKPKKEELSTIEIDLHMHQLLDETQGMSASDMLAYQLDAFHAAMKQHAGSKGQKIIFIHGKGEGVLRKAIEKELKTRYKSCEYHDASFLEYGFGATLVKIR